MSPEDFMYPPFKRPEKIEPVSFLGNFLLAMSGRAPLCRHLWASWELRTVPGVAPTCHFSCLYHGLDAQAH